MAIQDAIAKLHALKTAQTCAACGDERWEVQTEIVGMPAVVEDRVMATHGLSCVALLCKTCGYVRLHATNVLEDS